MATHRVKDRLLAASGLFLMMGLWCNGAVGQTPSVYTNGVAGYPAGVTYIPPQMPTYAGTPATGLPSAAQLQQQQLLTAPQQMPGQSQAAFGTSAASAGVASSGMLPVDPPGGLGGYNYPARQPPVAFAPRCSLARHAAQACVKAMPRRLSA